MTLNTKLNLALPDRFFPLPPQRQTEKSGLAMRDYTKLSFHKIKIRKFFI